MVRKVFVSYSHRLNQTAADNFRELFADKRDVFIDRSIREDIGEYTVSTIKDRLRTLIRESSVTVVLIGKETGGRHWIDWEIYNSLRTSLGNTRNGLLGIKIPHNTHWIPDRLLDNVPDMGLIIDWPRNYITLKNAIEQAYLVSRSGVPDLSRPLKQRNSYKT